MATFYMDFDEGVPRLAYTGCAWCSSTMGISLCQVRNRGCCSYFPKFYPVEIQRMMHSKKGRKLLNTIIKHPGTVLFDDHIQVKGNFYAAQYDKMRQEGRIPVDDRSQDNTIYFRTCPFVCPGIGCTLPVRYRSYVCNFFVCREVLEDPANEEQLAPFVRERDNYIRFLQWENNQLIEAMQCEGLTLRENTKEAITLLALIPIDQYEYPRLEPVNLPDPQNKGA